MPREIDVYNFRNFLANTVMRISLTKYTGYKYSREQINFHCVLQLLDASASILESFYNDRFCKKRKKKNYDDVIIPFTTRSNIKRSNEHAYNIKYETRLFSNF